MEQPRKEKYKNKSEIRQHKDVDWIEKAMGILTHPLTAQAIANAFTYILILDTGIEGMTGMDFADLLEKGRENKKKLKK